MIGAFVTSAANTWAGIVTRHALVILMAAVVLTGFALTKAATINISTNIDALMPEGAKSVQTLNRALKKTGSFASIQIVVQSDDSETSLGFIQNAKTFIDSYDWVGTSQYFEDIEVLSQHKLLLMSVPELLELERDVNKAYPILIAKEVSAAIGVEANVTLRGDNLSGNSNTELDRDRLDTIFGDLNAPQRTRQNFVSEDGLTAVLIVWPKSDLSSLVDSKRMVGDAQHVVNTLVGKTDNPDIKAGVSGRIASQVRQFSSIIKDLKTGLFSAMALIAILIAWFYRSIIIVPAIFIPLIIGIVWTLGLTTMTVGGLNLITAFLILILFGLGIDFGIHNTSRFIEERRQGESVEASIHVLICETGHASLIAALTTSAGFFSLTLTEFRAFTEFGFIAGAGILLTFTAMYSVLPALFVVMERLGWQSNRPAKPRALGANLPALPKPLTVQRTIIIGSIFLCLFAVFFAPQMRFESNLKKLEARMPAKHVQARAAVKQVVKSSNSRAIIVVETQEELVAIDQYFKNKIQTDTQTPTIKNISSILDFVPDQNSQKQRLEVIRRLKKRADGLQGLDPEAYKAGQPYLSIDALNISDLPTALRRSFLGSGAETGYLIYVNNAVNMDDARLAKQFYEDVAKFDIAGETYYSASQSFILVEMLVMMKADAVKAIALVTLTTALMIFIFIKSVEGTLVVLVPPLIGIGVTLGIMGAFGPPLSIMNMVILPSLVGISVDNGIHIFHRFVQEGTSANIAEIMQTTGRAAVLTTLTTLIGFGGMITASMGGLRSMALLAIIGFLSCLIMTWFLLPVALTLYRRQRSQHQNQSLTT